MPELGIGFRRCCRRRATCNHCLVATRPDQTAGALDDDQLREVSTSLRAKLRSRHLDESFIERAAEDAVAQAFLEYAQAVADEKEIPNPGGWIVQTAFWRAIDQLRREERESPGAYTSEPPEAKAIEVAGFGLEEEALSNVAAEALHAAVSSLPTRHQQALRSYYFLEMSTREAARSLRLSEPTFRRRLKAAMKSLRQRLDVGDLNQGDELAIEVGIAAAASLGGHGSQALSVGDQLVAALDSARHGVRNLAAQFGWSADAATTPIAPSVGRAATQGCAAAVSACLAVGAATGGERLADRLLNGSAERPVQERRIEPAPPRRLVTPLPRPSPVVRDRKPQVRNSNPSGASRSSSGRGARVLGDEAGSPAERTAASNSALGVESERSPPVESPAPEAEPVAPAPEPAPTNPTQEANEALGP